MNKLKSKQKEIGKVWEKFLEREKTNALAGKGITKDLKLNRVDWTCPKCGAGYVLEMGKMEYMLNWNFICKECGHEENTEVNYHFFKS